MTVAKLNLGSTTPLPSASFSTLAALVAHLQELQDELTERRAHPHVVCHDLQDILPASSPAPVSSIDHIEECITSVRNLARTEIYLHMQQLEAIVDQARLLHPFVHNSEDYNASWTVDPRYY
jgi:hypothetical protein